MLINAGNFTYSKGFLMGYQVSCDFLYSTTPQWVYLISILPNLVPIDDQIKARKSKTVLVLLTVLGVWLISFDDLARGLELFQGDLYIIISSIVYAFYAVGLGALVKTDDFEYGSFLGFVGVINCVLTLPVLVVFHWQSVEIFTLPPARDLYLLFIYSILTGLMSEYFWAKAATLLGASVSTVAYTLVTLPIGILLDYFVIDQD